MLHRLCTGSSSCTYVTRNVTQQDAKSSNYGLTHMHHPKVRMSRGTIFEFKSDVETLVDLDGETVGRLPLRVSILPKAFNVGAP